MAATSVIETDTPGEVLAAVRGEVAAVNLGEARKLRLAVAWAAMHSVDSIDEAATLYDVPGVDVEVAIAGEGAPLVAAFSINEFAAALGLPTEHGRTFLGEALELCYRLPRVWKRIQAGDLPAWRGRRIADGTMHLSPAAAAYVDRHIGPVAHKIGPVQTERLIDEAIARFMPELAEETRRKAADGLHFNVDHRQVSFAGTSQVWGELDLADALDLDTVVAAKAGDLKDLGCEESLDVRRALALGEIARQQLALDLETGDGEGEGEGDPMVVEQEGAPAPTVSKTRNPARARRQLVLYLHLHESAIAGTRPDCSGSPIGRIENGGNRLVTADQIRDWCGQADTHLVVKPVIDLADHVHVNAAEVPDRIAERIALRDHTCVFPWCTKPARKLKPDGHGCDCDHVTAYRDGGKTCTCQIAPLCRHHHRAKTHTAWRYTILVPGTYLWTSPHGMQFLRDHEGTLDVTGDRRAPAQRSTRPPDV